MDRRVKPGDDGRLQNAMKSSSYAFVFIALLALAVPRHAKAQTVAEFYARTGIRLLITADPGGSYDTNARLVGRHLGRHIPGNPRLLLEQMPGASGRIGANYLYNVAPRDGSLIALVQQSLPMAQATGESGVQYDASRLNWIGSPILLDDVLVVWHAAGVRSIDEVKPKSIVVGATTPTGTNYI